MSFKNRSAAPSQRLEARMTDDKLRLVSDCTLCDGTRSIVDYFGYEINCPQCSRHPSTETPSAIEEEDNSFADFGDYGHEDY